MPTIGSVQVTRTRQAFRFDWSITFDGLKGDVAPLTINSLMLTGTTVTASVTETVTGVLPAEYKSVSVPVTAAQLAANDSFETLLSGLNTGEFYSARVTAYNRPNGPGAFRTSHPAREMPRDVPKGPEVNGLIVLSDQSLKLVWTYPRDGGSLIS